MMLRPALAAAAASVLLVLPIRADVQDQVDWPAFLARHDLLWEAPPRVWHEGAFIGNGLLGSMIYAPDGKSLQWDIGRSDVAFRGGRIAIGRFAFAGATNDLRGDLRLDLWNAEARGTCRSGGRSWNWRSYVHAKELVTLIETEGDAPDLTFTAEPARPARLVHKKEPIPPDLTNPDGEGGMTGEIHWWRQPYKGGGGHVVAWVSQSLPGNRRQHISSVDYVLTGEVTVARAVTQVRLAQKALPEALEKSHRAWWQAWWPRSFLSIPDARMESFYWIQMYKLAAGTRSDRPALDLMGPWFRSTPWPMIWWNLNIQLTYWPVYAANRLDIGESLVKLIQNGSSNLIQNVPEPWRADSAAVGRTSSYDCRGGVGGKDGEERGNFIWTMHNLWLHYRYSGDEKLLQETVQPMLARAVGYYLHLLKPGDDGKLHIPLSLSPEYPEKAPDTTYDHGLLRWGLTTLLALDAKAVTKDPRAAVWKETMEKLAPYPVDEKTGYMIGAGVPLAISHRHFSHLMQIYPLHQVDPDSAADRPLIEKSLNHWISFEGALQGYSFTGASAMSSWLGRRDAAVSFLNQFLDRFVKPNTMYLEAGPVIETPLAAAAAIHELLLQSWSMDPLGTHLRVFPGVPDSWPDATFHKLLAEGAFEVSAVRRGGKTEWIQVKSLAGNPLRIRTGFEGAVRASGVRPFAVATSQDHNGQALTTVDLRRGETVLLTRGDGVKPAVAPVATPVEKHNFYGSAKVPAQQPAANGSFTLGAKSAQRQGASFVFQRSGDKENIGGWTEPKGALAWRLQVPKAGRYTVVVEYAATGAGPEVAVELVAKSQRNDAAAIRTTFKRVGTGGYDHFKVFPAGEVAIPAGGEWMLTVRSADGAAPLINLHAVRLVPVVAPL
jgi:alpha-L-fucosidase 2